jgi:hypothetical protein
MCKFYTLSYTILENTGLCVLENTPTPIVENMSGVYWKMLFNNIQ